MSEHSYSVMWAHIVFGTLSRQIILPVDVRVQLSKYFYKYSREKNIYQRINYVNAEHVHMLVDVPTGLTIEQIVQYFKGSSSYWINKNRLISTKFYWARGYASLGVSLSNLEKVSKYIINQEEHHRIHTFQEEYQKMMDQYNKQQSERKHSVNSDNL